MLTVRPTQKNEAHTRYETFLDGANIGHLCVLDKDAKFIEGVFATTFQKELCPEEIVRSLERFRDHGIRTGGFLYSVLCNDLFMAMAQADDRNRHLIGHIIAYCREHLSSEIWGSFVRVNDHIDRYKARNP